MNISINPNVYAQQYAAQNNISLSEAKSQLKSQYGDPNPSNTSLFSSGSLDSFTPSTTTKSADDEVVKYANENNTSLSEAKEALKSQFGDPKGYDNTEISENPFAKTVEADNEVVTYANYHNCSLSEAREALKNKFGNPEGYENTEISENPFARTVEADNEVVTYANYHNCSLEEARDALKNKFGNPQ